MPIELPAGVSVSLFVACVSVAIVVIGIAKAGFGGGIGILAVPLTIAVLPPTDGLGVMLPLLIAGDVFSYVHHRKNRSALHLRWLVAGGVVGIVLATAALWSIPWAAERWHWGDASPAINRTLMLVVGVACLVMVAAQVYRMTGLPLPRIPGTPGAGRGVGAFAGFVSTLAHSAGPVVNVYLLEQRLTKSLQVGTSVLFFLIVNLAKVPSYVGLGYITGRTLLVSLMFLPLIPVGTMLGYWMHTRVSERWFTAIMYAGAAAAAGHMIWKAVA